VKDCAVFLALPSYSVLFAAERRERGVGEGTWFRRARAHGDRLFVNENFILVPAMVL
jgi:hypothetical protein